MNNALLTKQLDFLATMETNVKVMFLVTSLSRPVYTALDSFESYVKSIGLGMQLHYIE